MVVTAVIVSRVIVDAKMDARVVVTAVIVSRVVVGAKVDAWVVVTAVIVSGVVVNAKKGTAHAVSQHPRTRYRQHIFQGPSEQSPHDCQQRKISSPSRRCL